MTRIQRGVIDSRKPAEARANADANADADASITFVVAELGTSHRQAWRQGGNWGPKRRTSPAALVVRVRLGDGMMCDGTPRGTLGEWVRLSGLLLRCSIVLSRPFSVVSQHRRLGDPGSTRALAFGLRGSAGTRLRATTARVFRVGSTPAALRLSLWIQEWIRRLSASVKPLPHAAHLCRAAGKTVATKDRHVRV